MRYLESIRVLHVDDEPGLADMTADFLERADERITVDTATCASDGLAKLEESPVDCIISDYDMPDLNGIQFLRAVREEDAELPFILFTGKGSEEVAADAIRAGATDYLQKQHGTDQYTVLANRVSNYAEKHAAEQQTERRYQAMKTVKQGIAITDEEGRLVEVNEAYAEDLGTTPEELIGQQWTLTVPDEEASRLREEVISQLDELESWSGETVGLRADGSTYPKWMSLSRLDDGGHICASQDISERKERERNLEAKDERLNQVATILSHDIRAPLTVAENNLHLAKVDHDSEYLDEVEQAHERLHAHIDDLLQLARDDGEVTDIRRSNSIISPRAVGVLSGQQTYTWW